MTTLAFDVDAVAARAAQVNWQRIMLLALMAVPYLLGATARYVVRGLGWAVAWLWAAAVEGWQAAGPKVGRP